MNKNIIKRKVDVIGRIKIPKEIFKKIDLGKNDSVEFFLKEDAIVFKKYIR